MDNSSQRNNQLIEAIATRNLPKINTLIAEGVDVNQFDMANDDFTPLMLAIYIERADIVRILLEAGADVHDSTYAEDSPLGLAATIGNLEIVESLLRAGANPDYGGIDAPLHRAASREYIGMVRMLIEVGANINIFTESRITPLMCAAINGNFEIVKILVEAGADVDATDEDGDVALNKTAYYGHQEIFDYLFPMTSDSEWRQYAQKELATGIIRKQKNK